MIFFPNKVKRIFGICLYIIFVCSYKCSFDIIYKKTINKTDNKTTVSDFVTHEPYNRTSSTALKKKYVEDAIKLIADMIPIAAKYSGMYQYRLPLA